ncbi:MAG: hypothetical protein KIS96_10665 [Bauldia sp.]|nr:hypothetical protein [Bauldia sp.]
MMDVPPTIHGRNNLESWAKLREFVAAFPDDDYWARWKPMVIGVLDTLESYGLRDVFRAGQSMHDIVFSTADHHGLRDEPRVVLTFYPFQQLVRTTYLRLPQKPAWAIESGKVAQSPHVFMAPLTLERLISPAKGTRAILEYLRMLWVDTKSHTTPLPAAFHSLDV